MNLKTLFCSSEKVKQINPLYLIGGHFLSLYLIIGFILRIVLMAFSPADATYTAMGILRGLTVGLLSDFGMGLLLLIPLFVVMSEKVCKILLVLALMLGVPQA